MFTVYIHILEVLAMNAEGTTASKIMSMGLEYSTAKIVTALRDLQKEGFVIAHTGGAVNIWQVTEKAIEYVETVSRKYASSHVMDAIADYVASAEMGAQEAPTTVYLLDESDLENVVTDDPKQGFYGDLGTPNPLNIGATKISFPLYGDKTIAEYVRDIESVANVKVVRADMVNDIVTLTVENIPAEHDPSGCPEFEECYECSGSCNYHEDWCPYKDTFEG